MSAEQALAFFADDPPIMALLQPMVLDLGLGYLELGQSSSTLSRGEAQRVKLATLMGKASAGPSLLLMDEPDRGSAPRRRGARAGCHRRAGGGRPHGARHLAPPAPVGAAADHRVDVQARCGASIGARFRMQPSPWCVVAPAAERALVMHTLVAEARGRFAESLPFAVRRHMRRACRVRR